MGSQRSLPDDGLPALAALLIYLACGVALLHGALLDGQVLSSATQFVSAGPFPAALRARLPADIDSFTDANRCFVPWLRWAADAFAADGRLPLWKDTAGIGAPFVGNGQSAVFFPPNLLAILLGAPPVALALLALVKLAGGAFCAWLLARHLGLSFLAALLCGLVFGFGGFQMGWYQHPLTNVSLLLPLLLLATDRFVTGPTAARAGGLALVAALQHLGGHPETAFHCQAAAVALGGARLLGLRRSLGARAAWRRLALLLGALVLGLLLGAIQVLPLLEYLSRSAVLARRMDEAGAPALAAPLAAAGCVAALLVAALALRRLARAEAGLGRWALLLGLATSAALLAGLRAGLAPTFVMSFAPDWFGGSRAYMGAGPYVEQTGAFVGAAWPLAVAGLLAGRPRGVVRVAGGTLAVGLLAGWRAPLVSDALALLPGFHVALNTRLQLLALLATAVLAGLGLDALAAGVRCAGGARRAVEGRRLALAALAPALGLLLALAGAVSLGLVTSRNVPARPEGASHVHAALLPEAELAPLFAGDWPLEIAAPRKEYHGYVLLTAPPAGIQLMYGRAGAVAKTQWKPGPAQAGPDGRPAPAPAPAPARGEPLPFVFRTAVPLDAVPPGPTSVRVRVQLADGSVAVSGLLLGADDAADWLPFPARPASAAAALPLLLAGVVLALAALAHAGGRARPVVRGALVVLVAGSLLPYARGLVPLLPGDLFFPEAPALDLLRRAHPEGRIAGLRSHVLAAESPTFYGVPDVRSYDALGPAHATPLLDAALGRRAKAADAGQAASAEREEPAGLDYALLDLLSVRFFVNLERAPEGFRPRGFADPDGTAGGRRFTIHERPDYLPRARLVGGAVIEADDARALARLREPDFPRDRVLVLPVGEAREPPPLATGGVGGAGSARIVLSRPEQVRVEIEPQAPCWLLLSDAFFPGWTALVDGQPREILRADVALRAVPVQPGERLVEFRYEPRWYRVGAVVSVLAALVTATLLAVGAVRRRRAGRVGPSA